MAAKSILPSNKTLCLSHISDGHLARRLAGTGEAGRCDICSRLGRSQSGPVINIGDLAELVYEAMLRTHDREGFVVDGKQALEPLATGVVVEKLMAEAVESDVLDDVCSMLSGVIVRGGHWFVPFDMDHDASVEFEWKDFEDRIKHESRLLTPARSGSLPKSAAEKNYAFVRSFLVLTEERMGLIRTYRRGTKLYRARTERDARELERRARKAPARELAAAPPEKASAGRMNAQGVSMFYVALDPRTACAEVAAHSPYSEAVVGTFVLQQPLRILDLTTVLTPRSPFDESPRLDGDDRLNSLSFYVARITQPVLLDGNHPVDYAPTQVFTDALREWSSPGLDGIAYPSGVGEGKNVVLFYSHRMWFESPEEPSSRFESMVRQIEHGRRTSLFRIEPATVRRYDIYRHMTVRRSKM